MLRFIIEIHDGVTRYLLVDGNSRTPRRWDTTQSIGEAVLDSFHVRDVEVIFGKAQALPCSALYSTTGQLSHPARNRAHRSHVYHGYTWTPLSPYRTSPVDTCNPAAACKGQ